MFAMPAYFHQAQGEEAEPRSNTRDVTPPGVTRVFRSSEAPAASDNGLPKLTGIHVLPNGNLRSQAATIRLYGVVLPDRKTICTYRSGGRWACGIMAFVALRNLVESRTISCDIKDSSD
jgi:endonuclease YncB( thermonuclease family)